jgi:hypothetical protein
MQHLAQTVRGLGVFARTSSPRAVTDSLEETRQSADGLGGQARLFEMRGEFGGSQVEVTLKAASTRDNLGHVFITADDGILPVQPRGQVMEGGAGRGGNVFEREVFAGTRLPG